MESKCPIKNEMQVVVECSIIPQRHATPPIVSQVSNKNTDSMCIVFFLLFFLALQILIVIAAAPKRSRKVPKRKCQGRIQRHNSISIVVFS